MTAPSAPTRDLWFAGTLMQVHADRELTGGQFALIEQRARRGFSPPAHVHQHEDQFFYVLEGEVTVRIGEDERRVGAGGTAWLPRGTVHTFLVESDEVRLLEISTPGGFEEFHAEAGAPAGEVRIPDETPLDVAALAAASARYGCDIVGPPMTAAAGAPAASV
jgi:quercetin dioxygenase-like cupin family protein